MFAEHYFSSHITPYDCDLRLRVPNLLLVGSILACADTMSYVCGAGFISSRSRLQFAPKDIKCVRGPLSASLLGRQGIHFAYPYGDPGILAPRIFPKNESAENDIGVIPHYIDMNTRWVESCRDQGLAIIDVLSPLDEFFKSLQRCKVILSSSLHGLIFAHAYGIPALWIELSDNVIGNGFKFFDYYLSMGVHREAVVRFRVLDDTDPIEIAKLATVGEHEKLLSPLETAIGETKVELEKALSRSEV